MIEVVKGNIIDADVDAIVNAANENLILGSGVAGAIRQAGGDSIQQECYKLAPIKTGEAATTLAGNLKQDYVIHAVAPCGTIDGWQDLVKDCICSILKEAERIKISSIAIPAIGTGVFGLPLDTVAEILIKNVKEQEPNFKYIKRIVFVLFDDRAYQTFNKVLNKGD